MRELCGFARLCASLAESAEVRDETTKSDSSLATLDLLLFLRVGPEVWRCSTFEKWFESIGRPFVNNNSTTRRLRSLARPFAGHFGPRRACMSQTRVAVTALCVVTISTALGIEYIHREQTEEKLRLREGVIRDQELLRRKEALRGGRDAGEHAPDERRRG